MVWAPALAHNFSNSSGSYIGGLADLLNSLYIVSFRLWSSFERSHPTSQSIDESINQSFVKWGVYLLMLLLRTFSVMQFLICKLWFHNLRLESSCIFSSTSSYRPGGNKVRPHGPRKISPKHVSSTVHDDKDNSSSVVCVSASFCDACGFTLRAVFGGLPALTRLHFPARWNMERYFRMLYCTSIYICISVSKK